MDADLLRRYLEFYQDLGITTLYQRDRPARAESTGPVAQTPPRNEAPAIALPPMAPPGDTLLKILEDLGDCRRCPLHEGRNQIVFGVGNEKAPVVFVGEGL